MTRLILLTLTLEACAGARANLVAPSARYPISISNGMRANDGHLMVRKEMKIVGHFHDERRAWGLLYSFVPLTPHLDESEEFNRQVAAAGGDAIVRLTTDSRACALDYFVILNFLPFWPGCANIVLDGDIISYEPLPPPPASLPASAPATPPQKKKKRASASR
jgi:hypothetical protein